MRIRRLFLTSYGPFTGKELDWDAPPGTVHIVFGENEAGKSSSLRALQSLCFGIEERSTDNHLHPYDQMLVGADMVMDSGESQTFYRKKGRKNTLVDAESKVIPDQELDRYLCGVGEEGFRSLYYLGYGRLLEGAEDLLKENGELGRLLAEARSDKSLKRIQSLLADRASSLFKGTARANAVIDKALIEYVDARKPLKKGDLTRYAEVNHELDVLKTDRSLKEEWREQLTSESRRLQRSLASIAPVRKLRRTMAELNSLDPVLTISTSQVTRFREAMEQSSKAQLELDAVKAEITWATQQISANAYDRSLVEHESEIQNLLQQVSQITSHLRDIPQRTAEAEADRLNVRNVLARFWPEEGFEAAALPYEGAQQRISALASEKLQLEANFKAESNSRSEAKSRRLASESALSNISSQKVSPELRASLRTARAVVNLETTLNQHESEIKRLTAEINNLKSRLGGGNIDLDLFLAKQVPGEEAVKIAHQDLLGCDQKLGQLRTNLNESENELLEAESEREQLLSAGEVPTVAQLLSARLQRDHTWATLKSSLRGDLAVKPAPELPNQFEAELQESDLLSDKLRQESDRAAVLAALDSKMGQVRAKRDQLISRVVTTQSERDAIWQEWCRRWKDQGIEPDPPAAMLDWLRSFGDLDKAARTLQGHQQEADRCSKAIQEAKLNLASHLGELPQQPLAALISFGDQIENASIKADGQSQTLTSQIRSDELVEQAAESQLQQIQEQLLQWKQKWRAEMSALSLPLETATSTAVDAVDALGKARTWIITAKSTEDRVDKMQRDINKFESSLAEVVAKVAPDLLSLSPVDAARQLQSRLETAKTAAATVNTHELNLVRATTTAAKAQTELNTAALTLGEILQQTDLETTEELGSAIATCARAAELSLEAESSRLDLQVQLNGEDIDSWIETIAEMDEPTVRQQIEEISGSIRTINAELAHLNQEMGVKQAELTALDSDSSLIATQYKAESALARVKASVRPYLVSMLAENLIRAQMEEYRKANQGPILRKASEIFEALTNSSFTELTAELDEKDQVVLIAVRYNSTKKATERLRVDALSSATRVGLYLALRLACIYHQVDRHEGVPFVADDILLDFDDARARKVLGELGKLSERTQVVMFTHHQHLVQIAQEVLGDRCRVQSLA